MKIFGSIKELASLVFRKGSKEVTIDIGTQSGIGVNRTFKFPEVNSAVDFEHTVLVENLAQAMTNKTIDGDTNTLQDMPVSIFKTELSDANKALVRDTSGAVISSLISNSNIASSAGIVDTKLATISTTGKVANSATTATTSGTANTIVLRDENGYISSGQISGNISGNAANVTGTVAIANGGTGQTTANSALNALLPSQSGQTGKVLSTNGSTTSWTSAAVLPSAGTAGSVYSDGSAFTLVGTFSGKGNNLVGVNSGGTAEEYKALSVGTTGTDFAISHSAGGIALNLPDASATARGVITTSAQTIGGKKTFDGGAAIKGDTSGNAVSTSYVGEIISASSFTSNYAITTSYADVTNASITLTAGVWKIWAELTAQITTGTSAANETIGYFQITNSAGTKINDASRAVGHRAAAAVAGGVYAFYQVVFSTEVTPTTSTVYKLQAKISNLSGTGSGVVYADNSVGQCRFYAIRIA